MPKPYSQDLRDRVIDAVEKADFVIEAELRDVVLNPILRAPVTEARAEAVKGSVCLPDANE